MAPRNGVQHCIGVRLYYNNLHSNLETVISEEEKPTRKKVRPVTVSTNCTPSFKVFERDRHSHYDILPRDTPGMAKYYPTPLQTEAHKYSINPIQTVVPRKHVTIRKQCIDFRTKEC